MDVFMKISTVLSVTKKCSCAVALSVVLCRAPVIAEDVLSNAIPADVGWYLHVDLPASETDGVASEFATGELVAQFVSLRSRLVRVPFIDNYDRELRGELSEERQKERAYWRRLLEKPAWWKLFAHEFIIAGRVEFGEQRRTWLGAFRVDAVESQAILGGLRELLYGLASLLPQTEIIDASATGSAGALCLYSDLNPNAEICVGSSGDHGETILISTSRFFLRQSMQLTNGTSSGLPYALNRSSSAALNRLQKRSRFLSSVMAGESANTPGFEFTVQPTMLFPDLVNRDPLLSSWEHLVAAGDFGSNGVDYQFDSDFPAGQEELERIFYRAFVQPIAESEMSSLLYRELTAIVPPTRDRLPTPNVHALVGAWTKWLSAGLGGLSVTHSLQCQKDGDRLSGQGQLQVKR